LDEWLSKKGYNSNLSYEDLASLLNAYAGYQSSITGYQNIIVGSATNQIDTQDVSQEAQEAVYGTSEEILN
jgi:hypothetical protein